MQRDLRSEIEDIEIMRLADDGCPHADYTPADTTYSARERSGGKQDYKV